MHENRPNSTWEYMAYSMNDSGTINHPGWYYAPLNFQGLCVAAYKDKALEMLGAEGWEMVTVHGNRAILKRWTGWRATK